MRNAGDDRFLDEQFYSNDRLVATERTANGYITCSISGEVACDLHVLLQGHFVLAEGFEVYPRIR